MESGYLTLPLNRYESGYELAYQMACEQLAKTVDLKQQCLRSGVQWTLEDIVIEYLYQPYKITLPEIKISPVVGDEPLPIRDKLLILHYFLQAKGSPLSNHTITYKELADGIVYFPTFYQRAIKPLVTHFGREPQRLLDAARILGGHEADYGDTAVTINAFSRVPITLVLWKGDEELTPEGNIIFNSTIPDYLPTEDINVLCETIAWRLVKLLKAGGDNPDRN